MSDRSGIWDIYFKKHVQFYRNILCIFGLSSAVFYIIFPKKDHCIFRFQTAYVVLMIVVFFGLVFRLPTRQNAISCFEFLTCLNFMIVFNFGIFMQRFD